MLIIGSPPDEVARVENQKSWVRDHYEAVGHHYEVSWAQRNLAK
jgi:hypothetical protein